MGSAVCAVVGGAPLDRAEAELFRVVLNNPPDIEVNLEDFSDPRLRRAFTAIEGQLAASPPGTQVDLSTIADPEMQTLARSLVLDTRPLPEWSDVKRRVRLRRLDAEVDLIEAELARMEAGSESHSESLRRLIALQQEKRSLGHD